uniref:Small ribosomal subunit protein uS15 N-terminal domain-containing protein n=1 Tax=Sphaeramia orbicularis TaxID=375764 RepID=A0A673A781_9TELE
DSCLSFRRKGLSQSALALQARVPTWLKLTSDDVKSRSSNWPKKA